MYNFGTNLNYRSEYAITCPSIISLCLIDTINSASSKWNSWPTSKHDALIAHLNLWRVYPSSCPGQMSCYHTCFFPPSHTRNSVHQEITFPCLGSISKNWSHLTSCTATMVPWATTISYMHYYNSFPVVLPTSTFARTHLNTVLTLQRKIHDAFQCKFCAKPCSGCQFLS